jgi:hypothetical protein
MKCGEVCSAAIDGGRCPLCVEIANNKRIATVEAREKEARVIVEEALKLSRGIAEKEKGSIELNPSDADYERVVEQIQRSVQKGHAIEIRIVKVYRLENSERERTFFSAIADMHNASTEVTKLFHGTSHSNATGIYDKGFKVKRLRASPGPASHKENMLGAAVYLCPDSSKAASKEYMGGKLGVLLLCDVLLGSTKIVANADPSLDEPDRRKKEHYDSVMMRRKTENRESSVMYDEYAVYDPRLVLPRYKICVEIIDGAPKGDFGVKPRVKDGVTFYDITFKDVEEKGFNTNTLEAHHFFKAQGLCSQLGDLKLKMVTYCSNPRLEELFKKAREKLEERGLPSNIRYFFHGTKAIEEITTGGFKMPGINIGHATDDGWWGKGIYLGVNSNVSKGYSSGSRMLLVATLGGRESTRRGSGNHNDGITGLSIDEVAADDRPVREGKFQSFDAKNGEFIVASPVQTLPCYIVHWA